MSLKLLCSQGWSWTQDRPASASCVLDYRPLVSKLIFPGAWEGQIPVLSPGGVGVESMLPEDKALGRGGQSFIIFTFQSWENCWSVSSPCQYPDSLLCQRWSYFSKRSISRLPALYSFTARSVVFWPDVSLSCKLMLQTQNKHRENMEMGALPLHLGRGV